MSLNILQVVVYIALVGNKNISIIRWPSLTKRIRKQIIKANSHLSDIPYEMIFKVIFKDSLYFFLLLLSPPLKLAIIHKKCLFLIFCSLTLNSNINLTLPSWWLVSVQFHVTIHMTRVLKNGMCWTLYPVQPWRPSNSNWQNFHSLKDRLKVAWLIVGACQNDACIAKIENIEKIEVRKPLSV